MKQSEDNQIDGLLRGWAKKARSSEAATESFSDTGHLDADELNSYAEGVLPAAARARLTSHLADCSDCRGLAAQLTLAAGRQISPGPVESMPESTWPSAMARWLSPAVLRYAMPAMAVIVLAIGFYAWRVSRREAGFEMSKAGPAPAANPQIDQNGATAPPESENGALKDGALKTQEEVASNKKSTAPVKAEATNRVEEKAPARPEAAKAARGYAPEPTPVDKEREVAKSDDSLKPAQPAPPASKAAATADQPEAGRDADRRVADRKVSEVRQKAPADQQPAPGKAAESVTVQSQEETVQNRGQAQNQNQNQKDNNAPTGGPSARQTQSQRAGVRGETNTRLGVDGAARNDESDRTNETRTVAGRKFRREKNIWIDIAYRSSQATTDMTRGSDQFRALVADEPGIQTIANQLSGEVIVVWKGHAYHIR